MFQSNKLKSSTERSQHWDVYQFPPQIIFRFKIKYVSKGYLFVSAAYFYVGSSKAPGNSGFRLRDERGT